MCAFIRNDQLFIPFSQLHLGSYFAYILYLDDYRFIVLCISWNKYFYKNNNYFFKI